MSTTPATKKKARIPGGKRHRHNIGVQPKDILTPDAAIKALRSFKQPKFDQTVNVVFNLGIDPKSADQSLRGSIAMPKGIGRSAKVICFCPGDKVAAAKA